MKKLIYLSLSILEFSKTLMYQFWYNCIKTKYQNNANLCHKDTDSFILHVKTKDVYRDIADNLAKKIWLIKIRNWETTAIGLMKNELGGKIMT